MSKRPGGLIVRDRRTGRCVEIPEEIGKFFEDHEKEISEDLSLDGSSTRATARAQARIRRDVMDMVHIALEYEVDPF